MALPQLLNRLEEVVPTGFIGMWSGSASTIPTGWRCATAPTVPPNLTDRFVLGAGKAYQPGATGGAATAIPSVAAGSAQTGIGLGTAAPGGTAGNAKAGIALWNSTLNIWTGSAGTGIGIQGTTLDGNTLPSHGHRYHTNAHLGATGFEDRAANGGDTVTANTGNSWAHGHGVSDPGHTHAVGSSEHGHGITDNGHTHAVTTTAHGHTVTDGGHTHTLTAQAMSTLPPYYALCFIMKL